MWTWRWVYLYAMESIIQLSCRDCAERPDRAFCDLPTSSLEVLDNIKSIVSYPRGDVLFRQGQPSRHVYILCEGRARLFVSSETGRRMALRTADAGEMLGQSACLAGGLHEVSAELLEDSKVAVVKRKDLMGFLRENRDVCLHVVRMLSQDLHGAYERVRSLGLARHRRTHVASVH